ncbi:MAG TPA: outer membrane lipoprotein-sorting protein [Terriglobales bacterium]|nr:outer membrane lipoprotein-sorting protein [Terriglobales bacterium]
MFRYLALFAFSISAAALSLAGQNPAGAAAPAQAIDLKAIVQHMEQAAQANREHYRAYAVTREYRLYGADEQKPSSQVVAEINFVPPATKDYKILESKGSSRGEGVVRHLLDRERKAAAEGTAPGAFTRENYEFSLLGEDKIEQHDCYVLKLEPKSKASNLFDGRAWVDKNSYLVRRVDGEMAKLPSWWLKSVHVTLNFSDVDGMWLQSSTRAVAEVRIFGRHTFLSHDVSYRTADAVAQNRAQRTRRARTSAPQAVLGAAIHER